jgi:antitoxin component YwqK of YwqJK toxin-antitoxin module
VKPRIKSRARDQSNAGPLVERGRTATWLSGDNSGMPKASKPVPDIAYYDDGGVRYRGFQLDGEPHGAWDFLRKDGSVMRSGEFNHGKRIGIWRTFDRSGRVVKETDFSRGR